MQTASVFAHAGLIIVNREILGAAYVQQLDRAAYIPPLLPDAFARALVMQGRGRSGHVRVASVQPRDDQCRSSPLTDTERIAAAAAVAGLRAA
jgi:hypothetical protein